jgi:hypothetical protein
MTTTAIIGLGNMGRGLAKRLANNTTDLVLAGRNLDAVRSFADTLPRGVLVLDVDAAIARSDIVVLALPFSSALEVAKNPALSGKVVVDITNPLKADFSGLTIGHTTSAAEELQAAAPSARLVKAYNTIFAELFDHPATDTAKVPVFLAGNDGAAIAAVQQLVIASGFTVEETGSLDAARLLEPLGMLNIRLGFALGKGTGIAPAWHTL